MYVYIAMDGDNNDDLGGEDMYRIGSLFYQGRQADFSSLLHEEDNLGDDLWFVSVAPELGLLSSLMALHDADD